MKFYVRVEIAEAGNAKFNGCEPGKKYITGCASTRADAERLFGFGNYFAVHADNSHQVRSETERAGFLA